MNNIPILAIYNAQNDSSIQLLMLIQDNKNFTYKDLREESGLSRDRLDKEIARLEGATLITSKRNPVDGRSFIYEITEYGKCILSLQKN